MSTIPTAFYIIVGILVGFSIILSYIIYNLLKKVEQYEDITVDQAQYLQNISNLIGDSQKHLQKLDENGVFESDDEVGYFFEQMKKVQDTLNRYLIKDNYAQKEKQG